LDGLPRRGSEASSPKPSTLVYPLPGVLDGNPDIRDEARITIDNSEDDASEDGRGNGSAIGEETPPTSDDDGDNEDTISGDSDDADEMSWGPSWSVRHFFRDAEEPLPLSQFHPKEMSTMLSTSGPTQTQMAIRFLRVFRKCCRVYITNTVGQM
jgi:hypothetical protein